MEQLKIYETRDYGLFKKLEGNRDLRCVERIKKSIAEVGYILSPICVNERMEVIDGQNRLQALKELEMPVHYYVCEGIGIKEAIQMNLGRQNWRPVDYAKAYALRGNENYKRLLYLSELSSYITLALIACICDRNINASSGKSAHVIASGKFEVSESRKKEVANRLGELEELKDAIISIEGAQRIVIAGISWVLDVEGVRKDRVKDIVARKYPLFHPVVTPRSFLENFSDIYNKGLPADSRLYFDAIFREELDKD